MTTRKWIIFGLSLALLVVCGLSIAIIVFTTRQLSTGTTWLLGPVNAVPAQASEERRFASGAEAILSVESDGGAITVTAGDGDEIVVSMRRTAYGATQAEAEAALAALSVVTDLTGNRLEVRYERSEERSRSNPGNLDRVDFTITVPRQTEVRLFTSAGDVSLTGSEGPAELRTQFGGITARDVTGALVANTSSGDVIASDVRATEGEITLDSEFGAVEVRDSAAQTLSISSASGALTISAVTVSGSVTAQTQFGEVRVTDVSAERYDLRSSSGDVIAAGVAGPLTAHSDFGAISVTAAEDATLDLSTASGDITFSGSLGAGPHTANTDFGAITLSLPEDVALDVDLQTDFGEVETAFPITTRGATGGNQLQGQINGGGDLLTASTNSGDVTLTVLEP
jgi:DUF4097 and DUF4098 domain-containing protein YvlB